MSLADRVGLTLRTNRRAATWLALYVVFSLVGLGAQALLLLVPITGAVIVRHRTGESSWVLLATSGAPLVPLIVAAPT